MPLVMPRLLMPLSLRYTSVVSLFGLLSVLNTCRHYLIFKFFIFMSFSFKKSPPRKNRAGRKTLPTLMSLVFILRYYYNVFMVNTPYSQ